jgi:hypothetical protein
VFLRFHQIQKKRDSEKESRRVDLVKKEEIQMSKHKTPKTKRMTMTMMMLIGFLLGCHWSVECVLLNPASGSMVEIGDTIVGAQAPAIDIPEGVQQRLFETLSVGYAHRLAMRGGVRAQAQLYVKKYPTRTVQTYGIGVLDPRNMWRWPDSDVPAVFELYEMTMAGLQSRGQIASLQSLFFEWAETHGQVLEDDLPRQCIYELNMDNEWYIVPFLLSSRSVTVNTTHWQKVCHMDLPPPYNNTRYPPPYSSNYKWPDFRDQMLQLVQCGVKKPLILEECMTHPWLTALLQNFRINLFAADGKTSGWRTEAFVDVMYDIVWPWLHQARLLDPAQSMIKQWINWPSPIMQEYDQATWDEWPATKPTPIPRSECNLASAFFGASSHYSPKPGTLPAAEMMLVDSPDKVNSFQPWGWAKSARRKPGPNVTTDAQANHLSDMADDWLRFIADYTNPDLFNMDLQNHNIPPFESVRATPQFDALIHGTVRNQINERLLRKGRPLNYPNRPFRNLNNFEGYAVVSRFFHDLMLKPAETGLNPSTWNDETAVRRAIRLCRDRAATLMEELPKRECEFGIDTIATANDKGYLDVDWKPLAKEFAPASDCRVTEASAYLMQLQVDAGETHKPISCVHPDHTLYVLADDCRQDLSHPTLDAEAQIDAQFVNHTCIETAETWQSLHKVPVVGGDSSSKSSVTLQFDCPYIPGHGGAKNAIITIVTFLYMVQVVCFLGIVINKDLPAVRAASWRWSIVLLLGLALINTSTLTTIDQRTESRCAAFIGLFAFGFTITLASIYVKLHRIDRIYDDQQTLKVRHITDWHLSVRFAMIVVVNVLLMVAWTVATSSSSAGGGLTQGVSLLPPNGNTNRAPFRNLVVNACGYGDAGLLGFWLAAALFLMVANVYLTWRIRAVPSKFSENKVLFVLSLSVVPTCVLALPMLSIAQSEYAREVIKAIVAQLLGWSLTLTYFLPKLYFVVTDPKGKLEEQRHLTRVSNLSGNPTIRVTSVDVGGKRTHVSEDELGKVSVIKPIPAFMPNQNVNSDVVTYLRDGAQERTISSPRPMSRQDMTGFAPIAGKRGSTQSTSSTSPNYSTRQQNGSVTVSMAGSHYRIYQDQASGGGYSMDSNLPTAVTT